MTPPQSLFDGPGLDPTDDDPRLLKQIERVYKVMFKNQDVWLSLSDIAKLTGAPEASVSARLRDLRKPWWGGHEVQERRKKAGGGVHLYRMLPAPCGLLDGTEDPHATVVWRQHPEAVWCVEHRDFHRAQPTRLGPPALIPTDDRACTEKDWRPVRIKCEGGQW